MFRSLRFRLPALFLAGIALALLIASAVALRLFQDYAREQSVRELQREAAGLTELFGPQIATGAKPYGPRALEKAATGSTTSASRSSPARTQASVSSR